jgi:glycosyltransferase involved in cell wall biosynthesis
MEAWPSNMYIILYGPGGGFPNGPASTSRTLLYARGLQNAGGRVFVLCPGPTEYPAIGVLNRDVKGNRDGVEFEYTSGTTIRGRHFLHQNWLVLKGLCIAAQRCLSLNRAHGVDALILYSDRGALILLYWLVAKLCNAQYIYERCEQPFYQAEHSRFWTLASLLYTHTLFRLFDGAFVISDHLWAYMLRRMRPGASLLKVPILVDVQQFSSLQPAYPAFGRYLAYCGSLLEQKDGVRSLMQAFASISDAFPDLTLVLIGDSIKASQIPTYRLYAEHLAISEKVVFTGMVARSDLPAYLANASILVLARPTSRQADAGFPTKLGEYLATGKPVLVTKTGEIASYLVDGLNVFFAPPDDVAAFAERLRHILLNPEESAAVGLRGQKAAFQYFDYRENGRHMKAFLDQLCQTRS